MPVPRKGQVPLHPTPTASLLHNNVLTGHPLSQWQSQVALADRLSSRCPPMPPISGNWKASFQPMRIAEGFLAKEVDFIRQIAYEQCMEDKLFRLTDAGPSNASTKVRKQSMPSATEQKIRHQKGSFIHIRIRGNG